MLLHFTWHVDADGDVERALLHDKAEDAGRISQSIEAGNRILESWVLRCRGRITSGQGSKGSAEVEAEYLEELVDIVRQVEHATQARMLVGVGATAGESLIAQRVAEERGGVPAIVLYTPDLNEEAREYDEVTDEEAAALEQDPEDGVTGGTDNLGGAVGGLDKAENQKEGGEATQIQQGQMSPTAAMPSAPSAPSASAFQPSPAQSAGGQPPQGQGGGEDEQVLQSIGQVLQDFKKQLPFFEQQVKAANPQAYQAVMGMVQGMIAMARKMAGGDAEGTPPEGAMRKHEDLQKGRRYLEEVPTHFGEDERRRLHELKQQLFRAKTPHERDSLRTAIRRFVETPPEPPNYEVLTPIKVPSPVAPPEIAPAVASPTTPRIMAPRRIVTGVLSSGTTPAFEGQAAVPVPTYPKAWLPGANAGQGYAKAGQVLKSDIEPFNKSEDDAWMSQVPHADTTPREQLDPGTWHVRHQHDVQPGMDRAFESYLTHKGQYTASPSIRTQFPSRAIAESIASRAAQRHSRPAAAYSVHQGVGPVFKREVSSTELEPSSNMPDKATLRKLYDTVSGQSMAMSEYQPTDHILDEFYKGFEHERKEHPHLNDQQTALTTFQHLAEDPQYYTKVATLEQTGVLGKASLPASHHHVVLPPGSTGVGSRGRSVKVVEPVTGKATWHQVSMGQKKSGDGHSLSPRVAECPSADTPEKRAADAGLVGAPSTAKPGQTAQ